MNTTVSRRKIAATVVTDAAGKVLTVTQKRHNGQLTVALPGGHQEDGENEMQTLVRECIEETGVSIAPTESLLYQVAVSHGPTQYDVNVYASTLKGVYPRQQRSGERVVSWSWLTREEAIRAFSTSSVRHIGEPALARLEGNTHHQSWRYDASSAYLQAQKAVVGPVSEPGHFAVGDYHTEQLGVPALYLKDADSLSRAAMELSRMVAPYRSDTVVGIAVGGLPLAVLCAQILRLPLAIVEHDATATSSARTRGAGLGNRCAVIDSTFHSGATARRTIDVVNSMNGTVSLVAVATQSIPLNTHTDYDIDVPVHALHHLPIHSWNPSECPLCQTGVPLDERPGRNE
ncbi:MAG: NUDIX domain-containing protein [Propionibacteriaceae bacterium]|nr:NUDIX domain-containing protein [Propionibacteriaceae bacterium]